MSELGRWCFGHRLTVLGLWLVALAMIVALSVGVGGVGLSGAIVIDAFVVRTALMHLCGRSNWWLPPWLDRRLPHVAVEVPDTVPAVP
jgi:RND superfamily putative drug exporter